MKEKKRRGLRLIITFFIILLLTATVYSYEKNVAGLKNWVDNINPFSNNHPVTYSTVSIRDLNLNTFTYVGRYVIATGKLYLGELRNENIELVDDQGYYTLLDKNCLNPQKQYVYANSVNTPVYYTARGMFTSENLITCTSYLL